MIPGARPVSCAVAAFLISVLIMRTATAHGTIEPPVLTPEQREWLAAASSDVYFPPEDDRLTEAQILDFLLAVDRAEEIEKEQVSTDQDHDQAHIACDRTHFRLLRIQAVKSIGGNWAEFDWIHRHLMQMMSVDKIAQVSHDSVAEHNLKLFRRYREGVLEALRYC